MLKLIKYLKGYTLQSVFGPLFKFLEACFELIVPLVMASIIDVGIKNGDSNYILRMGLVLVLLAALGFGASVTAQYFAAKASMGFGTALRRDLYRHINTLSHAEIDKIGTSTLINRITNDVNLTQTSVNMFLRLFMRMPFLVIGAILMSLIISVKLTLIFLIAAPIIGLVIYIITHTTIPRYKKIQNKLDKIGAATRENLAGTRVVRAFSQQKNEADDFADDTEQLLRAQEKVGKISTLLNPITFAVVNVAIILIIWFGGFEINNGTVSQGEIIALVNYMNQILLALINLGMLTVILTKGSAGAARINDIFSIKTSVDDSGNTEQQAVSGAPAIEFRAVDFAYKGSGKNSLDNISFYANHGETVGVVGGTGCGKTTLISLIPRFYDAEGEVLVNGVDVRRYPLQQLRSKIGIVPQRAVLYRGTIRSNLQWGKKDASDEEMWAALETAQAADFVRALPGGLDSKVSQGGRNFSGGQKQRLTIARAVVAKPEVLILDDSASALDFATDARLRKALSKLPMTVFIVSQRAASVKNADKIIVLDDGKAVGLGSHGDLFHSCEIYRDICLSQMSEKEAANG